MISGCTHCTLLILLTQFAVLGQLAGHQGDPKKTSFWEPFAELPSDFDDETSKTLRQNAEKEIAERVQPAMQKLSTFLSEEYLPHTRPDIGISSLPGGDKFYDQVGK
jgi:uncharacterized protein (DUF885 family)